MSSELLEETLDKNILILRLNRPKSHNALNKNLALEFCEKLERAERGKIKVVIITGAGSKAFCSGQDMIEESSRAVEASEKVSAYIAIDRLAQVKIPTIAAINGFCFGGGAALAALCDIRISAQTALFRLPGAQYGLVVAAATLPRLVGVARAKELIFTARQFDSSDALKWGFVNHVCQPSELINFSVEMAYQIADNSFLAVRESKRIIDGTQDVLGSLLEEAEVNKKLRGSAEQLERFQSATRQLIND